jgi:hypothetical protein
MAQHLGMVQPWFGWTACVAHAEAPEDTKSFQVEQWVQVHASQYMYGFS